MALFSFFKSPKPKQFGFKPRFYNEGEERRKELLERYSTENKENPDAMKARISSGFKSRGAVDRSYESNIRRKSNRRLLIILIVLFLAAYLLLSEYLPDILKLVE